MQLTRWLIDTIANLRVKWHHFEAVQHYLYGTGLNNQSNCSRAKGGAIIILQVKHLLPVLDVQHKIMSLSYFIKK